MSSERGATATQAIRSALVYSHRRPEVTREVLAMLIEAAARANVELRFDADEAAKHGLDLNGSSHLKPSDTRERPADICIVLGGDGTTLRFLRKFAGTDIPIFAINCGRVGFLATVDRDRAEEGLERALSGQFEVLKLPALLLGREPHHEFAINEISFQRGSQMNVAHLSYSLAGEEVVRAPCDGLIAATPTGSTAYNLSAGGPILAWDLKGYVVSMVAPHALSARAVVAAPEDVLEVTNGGGEVVEVVIDGMPTGSLGPGESKEARFRADAVGLAQFPGSTFYSRFREKLRLLTGG
jgi:NAD+ kinase